MTYYNTLKKLICKIQKKKNCVLLVSKKSHIKIFFLLQEMKNKGNLIRRITKRLINIYERVKNKLNFCCLTIIVDLTIYDLEEIVVNNRI